MTNITKRKLQPTEYKKLQQELVKLFSTTNKKQSAIIFDEIFTESEQTMFVKRLAMIVMFNAECSRYRVSQTLLVSESTVKEHWHKFTAGQYEGLVKIIKSKQFDRDAFWNTVEILLRAGMPAMGKDRWKNTFKD